MSKPLSPLDAMFLQVESPRMLAHVAGLQIFALPLDAPAGFLRDLVATLRSPRRLAAPWNLKPKRSALARLRPAWVVDHDVDLDYHVRHVALPQPGGERELGMLISRLHSHQLSRRRPLWECYVIEGLENRRFAVYTKIHHALADGMTAMRLLMQPLGLDPAAPALAPWAPSESGVESGVSSTTRQARRSGTMRPLRAAREVTAALARMGRAAVDGEGRLAVPFRAPRSVLNTHIGSQRRFATQQFDLGRIKALGRAAGVTVNDVVLALCGTALRRFLQEADALPEEALVAGVPISLRPAGDTSGGNAVTIAMASLATDIAEPRLRLQTAHESMAQAKRQIQGLSPGAIQIYTGLMLAPFLMQITAGLAGRTRPCFNVAVSNVQGPDQVRYLGGARLDATYPVSNPFDGQALNITCVSYAGTLNFGFTGCRDALPGMQRIAVYAGEALAELERAFGLAPAVVSLRPAKRKRAA